MSTEVTGPAARQGNTAFATSLALLLIRLVLGFTFFYHGSQKLFGWFTENGAPQVTRLAEGLHLPVLSPLSWAYMAALGEFCGGVLVFFGLFARLGTIPILVVMWVAIATVHGQYGFSHFNPPGYEYNLALIAMAGAILIAGPGLVSVDACLFRRGLFARGPQPLGAPGTKGNA